MSDRCQIGGLGAVDNVVIAVGEGVRPGEEKSGLGTWTSDRCQMGDRYGGKIGVR